jgi:hypothetical protein
MEGFNVHIIINSQKKALRVYFVTFIRHSNEICIQNIIFYKRHIKVNTDLFNSYRNWLLKYICAAQKHITLLIEMW